MIAQQVTWLHAPELKLTLKNLFQKAKTEQDFRVNQAFDYFINAFVAPYAIFLIATPLLV